LHFPSINANNKPRTQKEGVESQQMVRKTEYVEATIGGNKESYVEGT
jgi:hypothetical protein